MAFSRAAASSSGEESAYDDRMSLEHLCATCRAARAHARRASDHSSEPAAARSAWRRLQSLHLLLTRRWAQMEAPPQSTHLLLTRLCSQMEAPPQSLHWLLCRLCSQMEAPPQSLHWALCLLCSQMEVPPQSLHWLLTRLCSQIEAPPQSLHALFTRLCSQMEAPPQSLHLLLCRLCSQRERCRNFLEGPHRGMYVCALPEAASGRQSNTSKHRV